MNQILESIKDNSRPSFFPVLAPELTAQTVGKKHARILSTLALGGGMATSEVRKMIKVRFGKEYTPTDIESVMTELRVKRYVREDGNQVILTADGLRLYENISTERGDLLKRTTSA